MASDFSPDIAITKDGKATSYLEDYLYLLGRSVGIDTPASATAAGDKGTIVADEDYIYICWDTDAWVRVAVATW